MMGQAMALAPAPQVMEEASVGAQLVGAHSVAIEGPEVVLSEASSGPEREVAKVVASAALVRAVA